MDTSSQTLSAGAAKRILSSRPVIKDTNPYSGITVNNVSFEDKNGQPFVWTDKEGNPIKDDDGKIRNYAIANFNANNGYGEMQAITLHQQGDYQKAVNTNLSLRVSPELGRKIEAAGEGTLTCRFVELASGEKALLPRKFVPVRTKDASELSKVNLDAPVAEVEEVTTEA